MRTKIGIATFLVVAFGAGVVAALDNVALRGSDTLEDLTKQVLAQCPGASSAGITYLGGGSSAGEDALRTGAQTVSPMSRFLQSQRTCAVAGGAARAEGLVVALDGLAITADEESAAGCGGVAFSTSKSVAVSDSNGVAGLQCPGCAGATYNIADHRDVLRIIFAGVHKDGSKDCNSDVRHSLANQWGALFEGTCTNGGACITLKHAWRRADLSGTTDTFLAQLGLPAITTNPFCNGHGVTLPAGETADFLDADPVRRPCEGTGEAAAGPGEQACGRDGRLGLVLPVFVPENATVAEAYPTAPCSPGVFRFMAGPAFPAKCPNGTTPILGKCFTPVQLRADGSVNAACINRRNSCPIFTPPGTDCRAYNLFLRRENDAQGTIRRDAANRQLIGSFYRIHSTTAVGGTTCQEGTATNQIGCLSQSSPCSWGFAGREGSERPGATALFVRGIEPSIARIQNLVTTPTDASDDYPLSRKLYINAMAGFENVAGGELELARCFANNGLTPGIASALGFVQVPGGARCEDFDERQCGAASNVDACAGNPAGIP